MTIWTYATFKTTGNLDISDLSVFKTTGNLEKKRTSTGKISFEQSNPGIFIKLRISDLKISDVMI